MEFKPQTFILLRQKQLISLMNYFTTVNIFQIFLGAIYNIKYLFNYVWGVFLNHPTKLVSLCKDNWQALQFAEPLIHPFILR